VNNDLNTGQDQPPKPGGKFKFLLVALVPLPVGVAMFAMKTLQASNSRLALPFLGVVSFLCCIYGSIGMLGGYDNKPRVMPWISGIILGIALFIAEAFIVLFVGCVASFKGM
jgi:hypothetical protein